MRKLFAFFSDYRVASTCLLILSLIGLYAAGRAAGVHSPWVYGVGAALLVGAWLLFLVIRRHVLNRAATSLEHAFTTHADNAVINAGVQQRGEIEVVRERLLEAIKTIKQSNLGKRSGKTALYELPWYMVIGHPAAGKSSVIAHSGLKLPLATKGGLQGIGGTRNCDWFFTTEGILIDTAGRYSVQQEDRHEWLGFLGLLRKHRPTVPINGVIIGVSVADLLQQGAAYQAKLARQMRERIQELTEELGVTFPVYVIFTKVDLIAGFGEFFADADEAERERVWGATLPYQAAQSAGAPLDLFCERFDELAEGLEETARQKLALKSGRKAPGLFTFPAEFMAIKPALSHFVGELFEDNPYQVRPLFRGFYFTSALQEGAPASRAQMQARERFGLSAGESADADNASLGSVFLRKLFPEVIFRDKHLVQAYASPKGRGWRVAGFALGLVLLASLLGAWVWSYVGNKKLIDSLSKDVVAIRTLQTSRGDFSSRVEAIVALQRHLEQLQAFRNGTLPMSLRFGLYQGEDIEHVAYQEYFRATRQFLLEPVSKGLEDYLQHAITNRDEPAVNAVPAVPATPVGGAAVTPATLTQTAATSTAGATLVPAVAAASQKVAPDNGGLEDTYNALKTYLMLADKTKLEEAHLLDQLPRFWRPWLDANRDGYSREEMARNAEHILSFYVTQVRRPEAPEIDNQITLVEQTREFLKQRLKAMPVRDRVYSELKSRANTRFASVSVAQILGGRDGDLVAGSHVIPGSFTRQAWNDYFQAAIQEASEKEISHVDWVLKSSASEDLTLQGSPAQIRNDLERMYKDEYIREWQRFVQGIAITEFRSIEHAGKGLTVLGDPKNSPIEKLLVRIRQETAWDDPTRPVASADQGFFSRMTDKVFGDDKPAATAGVDPSAGRISRAFSGINDLMVPPDGKDKAPFAGYLEALLKVRARFNGILNGNDVGNGAKSLMQSTFEGSNSELADALKVVDEQMLGTQPEATRNVIRPLLVRPLMQSFAVLVPAASEEINQLWTAQVFEPWNKTVADKYPFTNSSVEASPAEIARFIGDGGLVPKFLQAGLGTLVVRRGDQLSPRTWANMGIQLTPAFVTVMPNCLTAGATATPAGAAQPPNPATTNFAIQPMPAQGVTELTLDIDGQRLRYRNGQQEWTNFIWPNPAGVPGVRLVAVGNDGLSHEVVNFPGNFGLTKLIESARKVKQPDGTHLLSWSKDGLDVSVRLRLIAGGGAGTNEPQAQSKSLRACVLPAKVVN